jgi:hypothetical protein
VNKGQDPIQVSFLFVLIKASRFLSSRSAWDRESLGPSPGVVGMIILGWGPTQLAYCLCLTKTGISLNSFAKLKEMCLMSHTKSRGWVQGMLIHGIIKSDLG